MEWLTEPFDVAFMQRALIAGMLVSVLCACAGVWVVLRGMSFLGDALSHGLLPGVAVATLVGTNAVVGAAVSAAVMVAGVSYVTQRSRLTSDTGIGLLFAGMLALGVIVISRSRSFAVDATALLFGDVLGASASGNRGLAVVVVVAVATSVVAYRPFVALCVDERKAMTLGMRPRAAHVVMLSLVVLSVVASFRVVGTMLVFGFLVAPPATAVLLVKRIAWAMGAAVLLGWSAVAVGLLVSWHHDTAASATIAAVAVAQFFAVLVARDVHTAAVRWRRGQRSP